MHRIYWSNNEIGFLSNKVESELHSHGMYQLFFDIEGELSLIVNNEEVQGNCIITNVNTSHRITSDNKVFFSLIISPTSLYASSISKLLNGNLYWSREKEYPILLEFYTKLLLMNEDIGVYNKFIHALFVFIGLNKTENLFDRRVQYVIEQLISCGCYDHSLKLFADEQSISVSRLSHLFKSEVGISFKSFVGLHQVRKVFNEILNGNSITVASLNAGFDSPSHFSATVKKLMGTPASFSIKDSVFLKV